MFTSKLSLAALPLALLSAPAFGQAPAAQQGQAQARSQPQLAAGARVTDPKGGEVGTITRIDGQFVILKTDRHEARLPISSFTPHQGGFLVAMSRDELNAAIDRTLAEANQKIVVGAIVTGSQGSPAGTISAIDEQFVTLKLGSGTLVRLPRGSIAPGPSGAVIGMTVAELEAAAAAAGGEAKTEQAQKKAQ